MEDDLLFRWVKLNPRLKGLRDEGKSILKSRRSSENLSRDSDKSERKATERKVTFIETKQPHNLTLKSMLWTIAFGQVFLNSMKKWAREKKIKRSSEFQANFKQNKDVIHKVVFMRLT